MLRLENLSKSFGEIKAVDNVSLTVERGEIFGLLGPNGAGKTTIIQMVAGLLKPDNGHIWLDSIEALANPETAKKLLGVVPQEMAFYEELSAWENLFFWGRIQGVKSKVLKDRIHFYLEKTGLLARAKDPLKQYSGGMKRRINLIIGLLHQPRVLLLDEPTIGIDVQTRLNIYEVIKEAAQNGTTILYTTHNLKEAEELCDRIAIMDQGKILACGTLKELITIVGKKDIAYLQGDFKVEKAQEVITSLPSEAVLSLQEGKLVLALESSRSLPPLLELFFQKGLAIHDISIKEPSLESVFLHLTGKELRE
ncbi:ABC transporter ATP-binding protein [Candidatus Aminicenantes bacterium AC-334-K16]|jgi:ABC-2 type transport system ATP-binding protein|nr:ABC transporter ATP-binding protein [Candidatus Aminicenantes bacterium AC-334-K16]